MNFTFQHKSFPAAALGGSNRYLNWRRIMLLAMTVLALGGGSESSTRAASQYEVKAAFLYNFAKFVDWPAQTFAEKATPLVVGILGEDPLQETLPKVVQNESVKGRPIEVRHYREGEDCTGCHVLFISSSMSHRVKDLLRGVEGHNILTVGDAADFLAQGGMINFTLVENSVRFDINSKAVAQAGLKMSSKLLAVARTVRE